MKEKKNKIPGALSLARHYSKGEYCDYPAELIFSAINSRDFSYDSVAVPVGVGIEQFIENNIGALVYLMDHNTPENIADFIRDPNSFFDARGVEYRIGFDEYSTMIFSILAEPEAVAALRNKDDDAAFIHLLQTKEWKERHKMRFPTNYLKSHYLYDLQDIGTHLKKAEVEAAGFPDYTMFGVNIYALCSDLKDNQ